MQKKPFLTLLFVFFTACQTIPSETTSKSGNSQLQSELIVFSQGSKINLQQNQAHPQTAAIQAGKLRITLGTLPGEDNIELQWEKIIQEKEQEISLSKGKLSLNHYQESKGLALSAFWPAGELYLSNKTSLWFPSKSLNKILAGEKTALELGLDSQSFLGDLDSLSWLKPSLKAWETRLEKNPKLKKLKILKKSDTCPLLVNQVLQKLPCAWIGQDWIRLKVLLSQENPLILSLELLHQTPDSQLALHPLALLKPWIDFEIQEILIP